MRVVRNIHEQRGCTVYKLLNDTSTFNSRAIKRVWARVAPVPAINESQRKKKSETLLETIFPPLVLVGVFNFPRPFIEEEKKASLY